MTRPWQAKPAVAGDLARLMTDGGSVITENEAAGPFLTDWRRRYQAHAAAIACPRSAAEVQAIVRHCAANGLCLTPQGGNTGMCGGASPQADNAVLLSLAGLRRLRHVSATGRHVTAEAGISIDAVNAAVAGHGLFLPIAFGATGTATLGGVISTNAGGMNVLRYGSSRAQVLGLEVVMADGTLWDGLRALCKDNSGPDLKQLFIGTEGTLGIVTAACMRLVPAEVHSASLLLQAADMDEVLALSALAHEIGAERLSSFELLSGFALREAARRVLGMAPPLGGVGRWYALVRFAGTRPVDDLVAALAEAAFERGLAEDGVLPRSLAEQAMLWRMRDSLSELHRHLGPSLRFDLGVPVERLGDLVAGLQALAEETVPRADILCFGHMGDGNLHFSICGHDGEVPGAPTPQALAAAVHEVVWALGGTISAEHGIGRAHVGELARQKPPAELAMARRLKQTFDPAGILNPGVLFGPEQA